MRRSLGVVSIHRAPLALTLASCIAPASHQEEPQQWITQVVSEMAAPEVALTTALVSDTVSAGEAIQLLYLVVNGIQAREFDSDPDLFGFEVLREDGSRVVPHSSGSVLRSWGLKGVVTLPAHGVVGRLIDLGCIGTTLDDMSSGGCQYGYELSEPGEYHLVTTYRRGDPSQPHRRDFQPLLLSDTLEFVVTTPDADE